jgi:hypothetical protein
VVTGGPSEYDVAVSGMTGPGDVVVSVLANATTDGNAASISDDHTVSYDATAPSVTIDQATGQTDPTTASPIAFTATFSEPVVGFDLSDVSFAGSTAPGTLSAVVTGDGPIYQLAVTGVTGEGTVVVSIPADAAADGLGNSSKASTSADHTVTYRVNVAVEQDAAQPDPTNEGTIDVDAVFSTPVTGFTGSDVSFEGSTAPGDLSAEVTGSGSTYDIAVTGMTGPGTVVVSIPADVVGGGNHASTSTDHTVTFDDEAPSVTIDQAEGQDDPTNDATIRYTVAFSEPVTGFDATDISLAGSSAPGELVAAVTGAGATYEVAVSGMTGLGTVAASIPAGSATDAAGNSATESTSANHIVLYDDEAPTVTIDQAQAQVDPTNTPTVTFTAVFSEAVTGFDATDVVFDGTTAPGVLSAAVTGNGAIYEVTVSGLTGAGTVVVAVLGDAASDAAGNSSTASTSTDGMVTFDDQAPTVTIDQAVEQVDPTPDGTATFTVTFSEPVTGFDAADVVFDGSTDLGDAVAEVTGDGAVYTVIITGLAANATVVVSLPAGAATDAAGNLSLASTSTDNEVTFDLP